MRSWLLSGMTALIATPYLAQADADPCLHTLDYKGWKEFHSVHTPYKTSGNVEVRSKSDYNYRPNSVRHQKVHGS